MLALVKEYFWIFFISMVPIVELRGAVPAGLAMGLPVIPTYIVSVIGNMLPVPVILLFVRKGRKSKNLRGEIPPQGAA